jgi:thiol:disulfide interchange protein DsbD
MLSFVLAVSARASDRADVSAALNATALKPGTDAILAVVLDVAPGFHAQSHTPSSDDYIPTELTLDPASGIDFGKPIYPPGIEENYPALGKLNVYEGKVTIFVPLQVKADAAAGSATIKGKLRYQICDDRQCYMPETSPVKLETKIVAAGDAVSPANAELFAGYQPSASAEAPPPTTQPYRVTELSSNASFEIFGRQISLGKNAYLLTFTIAFLVGIIFNIMPCVLPVLPLKAIGFYEVSEHNRAKCLALGAVFSIGVIASFAVLGLLVVSMQVFKWGELFSNTWFLAALVIVLLIMALSMFGAFTVNLPTAIYNFTPRHDTYVGNFLFGILTAALSTPCTFGMFFGLLAWALAQPAAIGVSLMIVVGAGMAFPYLVLSAFPGLARRFPRTGPWAETIKMLMGFLLLGTAAFFAAPFINRIAGENAYWWVIFAVVASAGVFLVWRTIDHSRGWLPRAVSMAIAIVMIVPSLYLVRLVTAKPYQWTPYTADALAAAQAQGKIVLIDFTATWCGNCHTVEAFVLNSRRIVKTVDDYNVVMLKADVTDETAPGRPLLNQLNPVGAIPLTAVYAPGLTEPIQLTGIYRASELEFAISRAASAAKASSTISSTRNPA